MVMDDFVKKLDLAWKIYPHDDRLTAREMAGELFEEICELAVALDEENKLATYQEALDVAVVAFRIALGEFSYFKELPRNYIVLRGVIGLIRFVIKKEEISVTIDDVSSQLSELALAMYKPEIPEEYYMPALMCASYALIIAERTQAEFEESRDEKN